MEQRIQRHSRPAPTPPVARAVALAGAICLIALLPSCAKKEIRVGYIAAFSGVMSELGVSGRNGARLAADKINAEGGLLGRTLVLEPIEDGTDGKIAAERVEGARSGGIQLFVGPLTSAAATGLAQAFQDPEAVFLSPSVTMASAYGKADSLFLFLPPARVQGKKLAEAALRTGKSASVAVETTNAAYTEDVFAGFAEAFSAGGGTIHNTYRYKTSLSVSLDAAAVAELARYQPELVVSIGPAPETATLVQQLHLIQAGIPVFAPTWSMTKDLIELSGAPGSTVTVAGFVDMASAAPGYAAFREDYRKLYGTEPSFSSILSFETVMALASAVRKARSLKPQAIRSALADSEVAGLQSVIRLDEYGDPERDIMMFRIENGAFVRTGP